MRLSSLRALRLHAAPRTSSSTNDKPAEAALQRYAVALPRTLLAAAGDLQGKHIVEIGPGDHLAAGLVMLAMGAASYTCLDRFPGQYSNGYAKRWYGAVREAWPQMFPRSEWPAWLDADRFPEAYPERIRVVKAGVEDAGELPPCDIVCSYAVGEHVLDVDAFARMTRRLLRPDGVAVHVVDFSQHFDWSRYGDQFLFLSIPDRVWKWMGSHRGLPNRVRYGEFVEALRASGLQVHTVAKNLAAIIPDAGRMQPRFRAMPVESIRTLEATFLCKPA